MRVWDRRYPSPMMPPRSMFSFCLKERLFMIKTVDDVIVYVSNLDPARRVTFTPATSRMLFWELDKCVAWIDAALQPALNFLLQGIVPERKVT